MDVREGVGQAHGLPRFLEVIVEVLAGVGVEGERQVLDHSPSRQLVFDATAEEVTHVCILALSLTLWGLRCFGGP